MNNTHLTSLKAKKLCKLCGAKCCWSIGPILTFNDIKRIKTYFAQEEFFHEVRRGNKSYFTMKKIEEKCFFLNKRNYCLINDVKPLDCLLFPIVLEISPIEKSDQWILNWRYHSCLLSQDKNLDELLQQAKRTIKEKEISELLEYSKAMRMSKAYRRKNLLCSETISFLSSTNYLPKEYLITRFSESQGELGGSTD
ncbi:MAG: YkgJ family cysteine cluster protein [Promethearchaeota archaeon]